MKDHNRILKSVGAVCLAVVLGCGTGYADAISASGSPRVYETDIPQAHTDEEWSRLRDNTLEWDELEELVHQYNPTICQLWKTFRNEQREGKYSVSFTDAYAEAEQNYSNMITDNNSEIMEAVAGLSLASSRATVDNAVVTGDFKLASLSIERTEKEMVETVRGYLINIYRTALAEQLAELTAAYDETLLALEQRKMAAGTSTAMDVLTKEKSVKDARVLATDNAAARIKAKQTVLVNLGWPYNAEPAITAIPMPTDEDILGRNPDQDARGALKNSYAKQYYDRALTLMEGETTSAAYRVKADNMEQTVYSEMNTKYNALQQALNERDQADMKAKNLMEQKNQAERQYGVGSISQRELEAAVYNAQSADISAAIKAYDLAEKYYAYIAAVKGLCGTIS